MPEQRKRTVKMCVCHRKTFEQIYEIARERGISTVETLISEGICGGGCGMCQPYLNKMMNTGETSFVPGDVYIQSDTV